MRAYELGAQGSVDTLRLVDRPEPVPGPGEALVRFRAHSLNYRDHMILNLIDSARKPAERIPLSDGAGDVVAVGDDVSVVKPGDRVVVSFFTAWLDGPLEAHHFGSDLGGGCDGTLAEFGVFPAASLVPIPDALSYEEAACLPCAAVTAWALLVDFAHMKAGDTVLLLGTGGVSIFGLQLAGMMGARSVIISSSDAKLARAREVGASFGVNYARDRDWGKTVRALTGGADIVIETGGAATLGQSIEAAAFNARIGLIGMLGGVGERSDPLDLIWKNITVKGILVGSRRTLADTVRAIALNRLKPVIDRSFPFEEAPAAYRHLASGAHFGKIVISQA
ncbi:MAG: NAD(P)-dependent alcohol dehydrogenase [Alphaproteobacteria bacterium]